MIETAQQAFVAGMQISSAIAAVVAVGLAVMAVLTLRSHEIPPSEPDRELEPERHSSDTSFRRQPAPG